jgi:hypothetical protein
MRWYRFLPVVLTAACVVPLTGALRGPKAPEAQPSLEQPAPPGLAEALADPAATQLLAQAVQRLQPPQLHWLQTGVWLRACLPGVRYQAEGRYLLAPGQRFRLELQISRPSGKHPAPSTVLSVSDGGDLWMASRSGDGAWSDVQRLRVASILEGPNSPVEAPVLRSQFLRGQALRGLIPLMRSLQSDLCWFSRETRTAEEVLTGTWEPGLAATLAPPERPWPEGLPRVCRLLLRGPELWPARIEWYSAPDADGKMQLLVELEFRDPRFNQPLAQEQAATLFRFEPGAAAVTDVTAQVVATLKATAEAIKKQPPPAPDRPLR